MDTFYFIVHTSVFWVLMTVLQITTCFDEKYHILPNFRTCSYKRTVKQLVVFRLQPVYIYLLLYKNICCWYSFELPRQVEAIQMNTNNIYFYKESQKNSAYISSNKPLMFSADLSLNCTRIRRVYYKFF